MPLEFNQHLAYELARLPGIPGVRRVHGIA